MKFARAACFSGWENKVGKNLIAFALIMIMDCISRLRLNEMRSCNRAGTLFEFVEV